MLTLPNIVGQIPVMNLAQWANSHNFDRVLGVLNKNTISKPSQNLKIPLIMFLFCHYTPPETVQNISFDVHGCIKDALLLAALWSTFGEVAKSLFLGCSCYTRFTRCYQAKISWTLSLSKCEIFSKTFFFLILEWHFKGKEGHSTFQY